MTAQRWWVKTAARWLARIDGVKTQVQMFSLAVTAFSTFSIMLQGFGLGNYVPYLGIVGVLLGTIYVYLYTEGGVWNQVARDRQDLSQNFAGPGMYIRAMIQARAVADAFEAMQTGEDPEQAAEETVSELWEEYRDGIEI